MSLKRKYRIYKNTAFCMAIVMLAEALMPSLMMAITNGPSSPEFSNFESASSGGMVNEFTGDFTYNIPVLDIPGANGGGYSCGLSYQSGVGPEMDASWVGLGWTLNPGAIDRNKKGFADDVKKQPVDYYNDVPANWSLSREKYLGNPEGYSFDFEIDASKTINYNNYSGFGFSKGIGLNLKDWTTIGYNTSNGKGSFSATVGERLTSKHKKELAFISRMGFQYGMHKRGDDIRSIPYFPYTGEHIDFNRSVVFDPLSLPIGGEKGTRISFSRQKNKKDAYTVNSYGYMYSKDAINDLESMMDYYTEKNNLYNKRDLYLSAPYSNADVFVATGEGIGGSFKMHNKNVGTFYPNMINNSTFFAEGEISHHLVGLVGKGWKVGLGVHSLSVGRSFSSDASSPNGNSDDFNFDAAGGEEDRTYFRFTNDLGGQSNYFQNTATSGATISGKSISIPATNDFSPQLLDEVEENGAKRSGRSKYIAYHTNSEMVASGTTAGNEVMSPYAYERSASTHQWVNRTSVPDGIGEIVAFNESGNRYVYGLPVYARKETNMQYDLRGVTPQNRYLAYKTFQNDNDYHSKIGEVHNAPYASTYLITEITTPDYVDRTMDGPSDDDFGGYTKFEYNQVYGTTADKATAGNWYKWRIPYNGLLYSPASLTDNRDDVGSFSSGEKEVYYLQKIETKTHVAVFVTNKTTYNLGNKTITGSGLSRQDGLDAAEGLSAAASADARGTNSPEMLERIELYAKPVDVNGEYKLIKTTHFEYDYSLCPGIPNNLGVPVMVDKDGNGTPETDINAAGGKLTLKKVWFEYEGVVNARISPYKFEYQYPTDISAGNGIPQEYATAGILNYGNGLNQNPGYDPTNIDRWGNYRAGGQGRTDSLKTWIDQTPAAFDPAAWHLKRIILPSKGEILVQYEQKEYSYVQNRNALAMVSLKKVVNKQSRFYLNAEEDLGIAPAEFPDLVHKLRIEFADEKIYFKFLYDLVGKSPDLASCSADYVDGYVNVKTDATGIGYDADGVYIDIGDGNSANDYDLPRDICFDYVKHEKGGKLEDGKSDCNGGKEIPEHENPLNIVNNFLYASLTRIKIVPGQACKHLNPHLSYFRIPLVGAKKGGGVRVKRLLMHDVGVEAGDEALYGTEYFYVNNYGGSSGVAVNEPSMGREENALVTFMPKRGNQKIGNKAVAGNDKEQFEGPLGEFLLPPPSVGYERVVSKSIHSGKKTNTGFVVSEFCSARTYYFDREYYNQDFSGPSVDNTEISQDKNWKFVPARVAMVAINNKWLAQGYRFVQNNMHGQPKSVATYAGEYQSGLPNPDMLSSLQSYEYYEPGEKVPMADDLDDLGQPNNLELLTPGKETEVVMERKAIKDVTVRQSLEADVTVQATLPFMIFPTGSPSLSYAESKLQTHVTTKIIRYPAIVKKVTTFQDGIYHVTENVAFNKATGQALLTRSYDGFNRQNLEQSSNHQGTYYSYSVPASSEYSGMGQRAANERLVVKPSTGVTMAYNKSGNSHSLNFTASPNNSVCDLMKQFAAGDLVKVTAGGANAYFHMGAPQGSSIQLLPALTYDPTTIAAASVSAVEIVRSAKTNQLSANAGSFTTYGESQNIQTVNPADDPVYAARVAWAQILNNAISSNNTLSTFDYATLTQQQKEALKMVYGGSCHDLPDEDHPFDISYISGTNDFKLRFRKDHIPVYAAISNPLPGHLNTYISNMWTANFNINDLYKDTAPEPKHQKRGGYKVILSAKGATSRVQQLTNINSIHSNIDNDVYGPNVQFHDEWYANYLIRVKPNTVLPKNRIGEAWLFAYQFGFPEPIVENPNFNRNECDCCSDLFYQYLKSGVFGIEIKNQCGGNIIHSNAFLSGGPSADGIYNFIVNHPNRLSLGYFDIDEDGYLIYVDVYNQSTPVKTRIRQLAQKSVAYYNDTYYEQTFTNGGHFEVNPATGQLLYFAEGNDCYPEKAVDFTFCDNVENPPVYKTLNNIIAASSVTYGNQWLYDAGLYPSATTLATNDYEKGIKGKWRMQPGYVYNNDVVGGSSELPSSTERSYNEAGVFTMNVFDWQNATANSPNNWIRTSKIIKYSPNGEALEKEDALGVKSTAKYGYKGMLPYLVANNTDYNSVQFESFENLYTVNGTLKLEEGVEIVGGQIDSDNAHSGKSSLKLTSNSALYGIPTDANFVLKAIPVTAQIENKGLNIKVWVKKSPDKEGVIAIKFNEEGSQSPSQNILQSDIKKVAQTGEWTLYEATIKPTAGKFTSLVITILSQSFGEPIWIDDVRVQPYDAQAMAYVYDNVTHRLLASFDDQHFGLYYQYNAEGKLVRKRIETERGMKTVQETQYHLPEESRTAN